MLRDVFSPGDAWFRAGDLMRQDRKGFFYFVDRVGDTFRWKSENVSTTEVANAILRCPGIMSAASYGVNVPHVDGRAGMVTLEASPSLDVQRLFREVSNHLSPQAHPVFLRIRSNIKTTGTFRPIKSDLMREGFDPYKIQDALFVLDAKTATYRKLDANLYAQILAGELRL